jgi:hypothetical protein
MQNIMMLMTEEERHAFGISEEKYNEMLDKMAEEAYGEKLYELGFTCCKY